MLLIFALAACGGEAGDTATVRAPDGTTAFEVEVADTDDERAAGLAGRSSLAPRTGMLFVFSEPVRSRFTMRDTLVPLSIAFLDGGGRVLRILDMEPCRAEPCPSYDPELTYESALEVNQGAFARAGIGEGDLVEIER